MSKTSAVIPFGPVPTEFPNATTSIGFLLALVDFLEEEVATPGDCEATAISCPPLTQCGTMHSWAQARSAPASFIIFNPQSSAFTIPDDPASLPPIFLVR